MPTADQWRQWADTALSSDDPTQVAEATRRLYEAARRDAGPAVRSKWDVSDDALQDLVHALLATRWDAILEAENPKVVCPTTSPSAASE
ncbi:MAG TPA: hypothetical protein RMH85_24505 [Polyangiaceae bacterium LLY-WYZ-15_(1-7)]|mgnify:CR=1 FL=1|nr:hypothetical protein [Myxococcales bacterium]MAT24849.1 hypothetical protein [Sandaracinus sp.]HJK93345.1 hypothetical protein [Polyangiaceae bacterium LLY-WYZ-15_(1-7)]MBJ74203.1 hypothetical protein [Sandaracinus sp.]HJL02370.1 hypothetical protein [Polyangiaceae bacterium LLY-WYZ-15_(1-7)]